MLLHRQVCMCLGRSPAPAQNNTTTTHATLKPTAFVECLSSNVLLSWQQALNMAATIRAEAINAYVAI